MSPEDSNARSPEETKAQRAACLQLSPPSLGGISTGGSYLVATGGKETS